MLSVGTWGSGAECYQYLGEWGRKLSVPGRDWGGGGGQKRIC